MARKTLSFEEVDRIVQRADLAKFRRGTTRRAAAAPADVIGELCGIWAVAGPIIRLVIGLPFVPKKWKDALTMFADLLDKVCV